MKKIAVFVILLLFSCGLVGFGGESFACCTEKDACFQQYFHELFGDDVSQKAHKTESVYVSGSPLGFTLFGDGVVVVGVGDVESACGKVSPCEGQDIKEGDVLLSIDGERIDGYKMIENILNQGEGEDKTFELVVLRDKKRLVSHVVPAVDIHTGKKRIGLWIRDNTAGVGTLTFVSKNGRFGALGHPVCDVDTGTFLPVKSGELYPCNIVAIEKSAKNKTGELRGIFFKSGSSMGKVSKNNEFGVYGEISQNKALNLKEVKVAKRGEIRPGKAKILTTISGTEPKEYDIEIIKTQNQNSCKSKSMVIRIVDQELLSKTGGIVQGMSGSPILQNGKFVGAVTHVFVSDPTKGFGIYAEWMIEQ